MRFADHASGLKTDDEGCFQGYREAEREKRDGGEESRGYSESHPAHSSPLEVGRMGPSQGLMMDEVSPGRPLPHRFTMLRRLLCCEKVVSTQWVRSFLVCVADRILNGGSTQTMQRGCSQEFRHRHHSIGRTQNHSPFPGVLCGWPSARRCCRRSWTGRKRSRSQKRT